LKLCMLIMNKNGRSDTVQSDDFKPCLEEGMCPELLARHCLQGRRVSETGASSDGRSAVATFLMQNDHHHFTKYSKTLTTIPGGFHIAAANICEP